MTDVSIIIVTWNTEIETRECLSSIFTSDISADKEVIVIDNNSSDSTAQMIKDRFPNVKLIENQRNQGFGYACNQGIKNAKGDYILLLNSDTIVRGQAIDKCIQFLEFTSDAGAVGCQLRNKDDSIQHSCYNFITLSRVLYENVPLKSILPIPCRQYLETGIDSWDYNSIRSWDYVMGAFFMIPSETVDEVGVLDERFFMYAEEADLAFRMEKEGLKVYYLHEEYVYHKKAASGNQLESKLDVQKTLSRAQFMKKHYTGRTSATYCLIVILYSIALIPYSVTARNTNRIKIQLAKIKVLLKFLLPCHDLSGTNVME